MPGHATREIVEGVKLHDVSIIVMGSRAQRSGWLVFRKQGHKMIYLADPPHAGCSLIEMTDWVATG